MARARKAKLRSQRIELDYFKRPGPLRRWRLWLSLLVLAVAGAWLAGTFGRGAMTAASPGPVSTAHAMLERRCEVCHADATRLAQASDTPLWRGASDTACRTCHTVPDHETNQAHAPSCLTCHVEHQGTPDLARVASERCVACHADLAAHTRGEPRLVATDGRRIRSLTDGHPELAVWTDRQVTPRRARLDNAPPPRDSALLALNHAKHLKPDLPGPQGLPAVQLGCSDCHQGPMTAATWRFGKPPPGWTPATAPDLAPAEEPPYMAPVRYAQHCAGCHPHDFADARFPDLPAPHDTPDVIRAFLQGLYARYIVSHPEELEGPPQLRPFGDTATARTYPTADDWVRAQVAAAEAVLFRDPKRCRFCHTLEESPESDLPRVAPTKVPVRWLPHARFDHGVHRLLACGECHAARQSERTEDVLMPGIATCRSCHTAGLARDDCAGCHTYHAATAPVPLDGGLRIGDVAARRP